MGKRSVSVGVNDTGQEASLEELGFPRVWKGWKREERKGEDGYSKGKHCKS